MGLQLEGMDNELNFGGGRDVRNTVLSPAEQQTVVFAEGSRTIARDTALIFQVNLNTVATETIVGIVSLQRSSNLSAQSTWHYTVTIKVDGVTVATRLMRKDFATVLFDVTSWEVSNQFPMMITFGKSITAGDHSIEVFSDGRRAQVHGSIIVFIPRTVET